MISNYNINLSNRKINNILLLYIGFVEDQFTYFYPGGAATFLDDTTYKPLERPWFEKILEKNKDNKI